MFKIIAASAIVLSAEALSVEQQPQRSRVPQEQIYKKFACITEDEINFMMDTWLGALQQIGQAFTTGDATKKFDPKIMKNKQDCHAATAHAKAVLESAYAYANNVSVLFKPTYASGATTFRPTQDGALAYFVGKKCMDEVYPEGDWTAFANDQGFALGATHGERGDPSTYMGFDKGSYSMPHYLTAKDNADFCDVGMVQAQLTIPPVRARLDRSERVNQRDVDVSAVDKSFALMRNPDYVQGQAGSLPLKLVKHHSSPQNKEEDNLDTPWWVLW